MEQRLILIRGEKLRINIQPFGIGVNSQEFSLLVEFLSTVTHTGRFSLYNSNCMGLILAGQHFQQSSRVCHGINLTFLSTLLLLASNTQSR